MAQSEALLGTPTTWLRAERARRPGVIPTHGVGANLLRIIREQPGIHFRALGRQAGLTSSGQLRHHLDRLADLGAIAEVKDGRFSRFFSGGDEDPTLRLRQARLSRPVPNLIARLLADRPMSRTELRRRLGCADSTLGYHLNRLVQVGDIQRRIGPNGHEYALSDATLTPPELPWRRPAEPQANGNASNNGNGLATVQVPPAAPATAPSLQTPVAAAPMPTPTPLAASPTTEPAAPAPTLPNPQPQPQQPRAPAELPAPSHGPAPAPGTPAADPRSFLVPQ